MRLVVRLRRVHRLDALRNSCKCHDGEQKIKKNVVEIIPANQIVSDFLAADKDNECCSCNTKALLECAQQKNVQIAKHVIVDVYCL